MPSKCSCWFALILMTVSQKATQFYTLGNHEAHFETKASVYGTGSSLT